MTIGGLTAAEWFHVALSLGFIAVTGACGWLAITWIGGGVRRSRQRRRERERRNRPLSQSPAAYLRERSRGEVSETPSPFPFNEQ